MTIKLKTTKKQITSQSSKILKLHYCECQTLLHYSEPFAYSSGAYGWACDYYDINGIIISTGYSPIGQKADYKLCDEYEKLAQEVVYNNYNESFEIKKDKVTKLLNDFIKKCL